MKTEIINILGGKIFGIIIYLIHWSLVGIIIYLILFSNDLITLLLVDLFIYLIIQTHLIFGQCPINIIEDIYIGKEKRQFEDMVQYRKIITNESSIHHLFMGECVALFKTGLILLNI